MQAIHLESASGQEEIGILHMVETDCASASHRRGSAIHDHSPLHTFLFNGQGQLLFANKAAAKVCQVDSTVSGLLH